MRRLAVPMAAAVLVAVLAAPAAPAAAAQPAARREQVSASLQTLIGDLSVSNTTHTGYNRDLFKTWIDADGDGCDTREEVLLAEAVQAPTRGSGCTLSGGEWYSWYDQAYWHDKSDVDIDHKVPLGEAWQSGAYNWSSTHREAYANDLGDSRLLDGVTDNVNQSKGDRDPAGWMPPSASATCRYIDDWVAMKTRWQLTVDSAELSAIQGYADGCTNVTITVTIATW